ncbi:MAG: hypothetical protein ABEJ25_08045 [Candidatus Bipolaricaulia bacterium]
MGKGRRISIESLIEDVPLAVFDLDPEGRVKFIWSEAAEETSAGRRRKS